jgi:hypothetical protein
LQSFNHMIKFTTTILKFEKQGEKTGWTYIEIPAELAQQLKPGNKKEFKVKGKLDNYNLVRVSILPMGDGNFILPINAAMRKAIGKRQGAMLTVQMQEDKSEFVFDADFIDCLADEPAANNFFNTLTGSHQRYFSKWISSAKTEETKTKRITVAVNALARKMDYGSMIRSQSSKNN